jgi:hypothetical protein
LEGDSSCNDRRDGGGLVGLHDYSDSDCDSDDYDGSDSSYVDDSLPVGIYFRIYMHQKNVYTQQLTPPQPTNPRPGHITHLNGSLRQNCIIEK